MKINTIVGLILQKNWLGGVFAIFLLFSPNLPPGARAPLVTPPPLSYAPGGSAELRKGRAQEGVAERGNYAKCVETNRPFFFARNCNNKMEMWNNFVCSCHLSRGVDVNKRTVSTYFYWKFDRSMSSWLLFFSVSYHAKMKNLGHILTSHLHFCFECLVTVLLLTTNTAL